MKTNPYKSLLLASALLAATLTPLNLVQAANYSAPTAGLPGVIQLKNVAIDGTGGGNVGGVLTAQDNQPLSIGQIFQVTGGAAATGSVDGSFSDFDGKLLIPKLPQSVLLIRTNASPLQFTVTALSSSAGANGAQGPIGLTGAAGVAGETGAQGPIGLPGAAGEAGATGAQGPTGLAGAAGPAGATGAQGPIGLTGANGADAPTHAIGEQYAGGRVFYVYDGGRHGLIAALADQNGGVGIRWHNTTDITTFAEGNGIGAGEKNTAIIIARQAGDGANLFAARVAAKYSVLANGVTPCTPAPIFPTLQPAETCIADWYLPSRVELNLLYLQKAVVGGFANAFYWSSTEEGEGARDQDFDTGNQDFGSNKGIKNRVRAVRAF